MDPDVIQLSDGRKFKVPGFGGLTPTHKTSGSRSWNAKPGSRGRRNG